MPRRSAYSTSAPRARISAAMAQARAAPTARATSRSQFGVVLVRRAIAPIEASSICVASGRCRPCAGQCRELTLDLWVERALVVAQPGLDRAAVVIDDSLWL